MESKDVSISCSGERERRKRERRSLAVGSGLLQLHGIESNTTHTFPTVMPWRHSPPLPSPLFLPLPPPLLPSAGEVSPGLSSRDNPKSPKQRRISELSSEWFQRPYQSDFGFQSLAQSFKVCLRRQLITFATVASLLSLLFWRNTRSSSTNSAMSVTSSLSPLHSLFSVRRESPGDRCDSYQGS
jgi:hypothetical protein